MFSRRELLAGRVPVPLQEQARVISHVTCMGRRRTPRATVVSPVREADSDPGTSCPDFAALSRNEKTDGMSTMLGLDPPSDSAESHRDR